jgi:hypothetical protein
VRKASAAGVWLGLWLFVWLSAAALADDGVATGADDPPWSVDGAGAGWLMRHADRLQAHWSQQVIRFSRSLDHTLDPAVDYPEEAYDSVLRLRLRSTLQEGGQTLGASIDGSLSLPGVQDRLRLVFDGVDSSDPSWFRQGALGAERASGQRVGLDFIRPLRFYDTDVGLRIRSGSPVDLLKRVRISRLFELGDWDVRPRLRVFHADSIGLGYGFDLSSHYPLANDMLLLSDTSAFYYEREDRVRYAQSVRVHQRLAAGRSLVWEVGAEGQSRPTHELTMHYAQVAFRSRLQRDWLIMELRPQVRRDREGGFSPEARLFLGLEVLFGNPGAY